MQKSKSQLLQIIPITLLLLTACGGDGSAEKSDGNDSSQVESSPELKNSNAQDSKKANCPPVIKTTAPGRIPTDATVQKIFIGMSFDEVNATLKCKFPENEPSATSAGFKINIYNSGVSIRQSLVSANLPLNRRLYNPGEERIDVALMGWPGEERVKGATHRRIYQLDARPPVENVERALSEKYGQPSYEEVQSSYKLFYWVHDVDGKPKAYNPHNTDPLCSPPQPHLSNIGTPPVLRAVENCGFAVGATVHPAKDNPALASGIAVTIADPHGTMISLSSVQEKLDADEEARRIEESKQAKDNKVDL